MELLNELDISNVKYNYGSSANVYTNFKAPDANYALMSEPEISRLIIEDKVNIKTIDLKTVLGTDFAQACVYVNSNSTNSEDVNKVLTLMGEMNKVLNENNIGHIGTICGRFYAMDREQNYDRTLNESSRNILKGLAQ